MESSTEKLPDERVPMTDELVEAYKDELKKWEPITAAFLEESEKMAPWKPSPTPHNIKEILTLIYKTKTILSTTNPIDYDILPATDPTDPIHYDILPATDPTDPMDYNIEDVLKLILPP